MSFSELMKKGPLFLDGGMGSLLQAQGLMPGEAPETWNLTHPEKITAIHRAYYEAGSHLVMANTFGVHPLRYPVEECEKMLRAAVDCVKASSLFRRRIIFWCTMLTSSLIMICVS